MKKIRIAIVGDFNPAKHTHLALNEAVEHVQKKLKQYEIETIWIASEAITPLVLSSFNGIWIAPGSPYKNDDAVYDIIQWARENDFPILGTCGGFQYMVVEYARNVIGIKDADHEESTPQSTALVIAKLSCSLKGQQENVIIQDHNSWLYRVLSRERITGFFNCSYGVNPAYQKKINAYPFVFTAFSESGEVRALELKGHRFYNGTLFQPPLESTPDQPNPLLLDFFKTVAEGGN